MRKNFTEYFSTDEGRFLIKACAKFDDSFSLTGEIYHYRSGKWYEHSGGCIHDDIAKHLPQLRPYIKWHLVGRNAPMHYIANTLFLAGDKDCWGLRKGETRQIVNGRTGLPSWRRMANVNGELVDLHELDKYLDSAERPTETITLTWEPWLREGEGKERELDLARSSAVWPDATDEELMAPDLKEKLEARLPALMQEFERDMKSLFEVESLVTL